MSSTTVFIRARNEADYIGRTLQGLRAQTCPPDEVIVLDNDSEDHTAAVAGTNGAVVESISEGEFSYGRALNRAVEVSHGDTIVFLSAHSPPVDTHWLAQLLRPLNAGECDVTFGRQVPEAGVNPLEEWVLLRTFPRRPSTLLQHLGFQKITFSNANSAVRAALLRKHPFREDLAFAEDLEWARRVESCGARIGYCPQAAVYHSHRFSAGQLERRMYAAGRAMAQAGSGGLYRSRCALLAARVLAMTADAVYCMWRGYWPALGKIFAYRREYFGGVRRGVLDYDSGRVSNRYDSYDAAEAKVPVLPPSG